MYRVVDEIEYEVWLGNPDEGTLLTTATGYTAVMDVLEVVERLAYAVGNMTLVVTLVTPNKSEIKWSDIDRQNRGYYE